MADHDFKISEKKVDETWKEHISHEKSSPEVNNSSQIGAQAKSEGESAAFSELLTSLAVQVLTFLGELENPITKTKSKDLNAAKEVIDLLLVLKRKTTNNLTAGESQLFDSILADLQIKFVQSASD